jgi:hypothetical protein
MLIKFIILYLLVFGVHAAPEIIIHHKESQVQQGHISDAVLELTANAVQSVDLQKLKNKNLSETLYIQGLSPLVRRDNTFAADAKVIFLKVPDAKTLTTENITIKWNVQVIPTEPSKDFLFGDFSAPARSKLMIWPGAILLIVSIAFSCFKVKQKWNQKQLHKSKLKNLRNQIFNANSYDEIVGVWNKKQAFLIAFPFLKDSFKELETVLFKHQFKPRQTQSEKDEVIDAYKTFLSKIEGGFNGI